MAHTKNYPFYDWVPKPLGIIILIMLFCPIMFINGAYTINSGEMSSGLGIISEHIQYASYAGAIGMVVFAPFMQRVLAVRRPKMMLMTGFILLFWLSYICAITDSWLLLMLCSLITGFIRMALTLINLFALILYAFKIEASDIITPGAEATDPVVADKNDQSKGLTQPIIYLFFMLFAQAGNSLTAWLAYEYEWQYVYYYMMGMLMLSIVVVLSTMKYQRHLKKLNFNLRQFGDVIAASLMMMAGSFILIYGKTLDWFDNYYIRLAAILFLLSTAALIFIEGNLKHPYLKLGVFKQKNVIFASITFIMLMMINCSAMFVSVFTSISMKIDNFQNAMLGNYSLVGYVIGAILCMILSAFKIPFKYIFAFGFSFITAYAIYMYFQYQSMGLYEHMIWATILRSTGMMILYTMCAVLGSIRLPLKYMSSWIFVMLFARSIIGPTVGTAIYSNLLNERQQHYMATLSTGVDLMNPEIAGSFNQTVKGSQFMQGHSAETATTLATMQVSGRIQVQAMLSALKEITGWTIFASILFIIIVLCVRYKQPEYPGILNLKEKGAYVGKELA